MNDLNKDIDSNKDIDKKRGFGGKLIIFGVILGICLIIAAGIGSFTFYKVRTGNETLTVTGSVKQKVTSDLVKWTGTFQRNIPQEDLKNGYAQMKADEALVLKFFKDNGFNESMVRITPVFMEAPFQYDPNAPKEYILRQNVEIQSNEIQKITSMAKNTQMLIDQGVIYSTNSLEYYYTKLPELRITLLKDAVSDAKMRAQKIAESTGLQVGSIKSANAGVVQVLQVNSTDISDYGAYDTSTIEKEVMVIVTAIFNLK
ncbi:MAG: SIMPL domain-containing protein [Actinobacteria bacterium]|nr:SIMPL domain-containing protein [Actinomycetota bacterium]